MPRRTIYTPTTADVTAVQLALMTLLAEVAASKGDQAETWLREFEDAACRPLATGTLEGISEEDRDAFYGAAARKIGQFTDWAAARVRERRHTER